MSTTAVQFRNFPDTEVKNVLFSSSPETGGKDTFFVYISKFLSGNSVEVRPMTYTDVASFKQGRAIVEHGFVAGIEKDADTLILKIYSAYASKFPGKEDIKVTLTTDESSFDLGAVKKDEVVFRDPKAQVLAHGYYGKYLQAAAAELQKHASKV